MKLPVDTDLDLPKEHPVVLQVSETFSVSHYLGGYRLHKMDSGLRQGCVLFFEEGIYRRHHAERWMPESEIKRLVIHSPSQLPKILQHGAFYGLYEEVSVIVKDEWIPVPFPLRGSFAVSGWFLGQWLNQNGYAGRVYLEDRNLKVIESTKR
jgi:hypothetical protein